jgi:Periplasmic protease
MVGMLVGKGPVVQVRGKDGKSSVLSARSDDAIYDGPFAVMVNEESASASEIFAAAIQDYKRGIIIGSTSTYGKGTVQRPVPIGKILDYNTGQSENGSVKITFQKFYRINGQSTQRKGVSSDIVIPDMLEYSKIREKNEPSSLPWDEINQCNYQVWQGYNDFTDIVKRENDSISNNPDFKTFSSNTQWLYNSIDEPVSLNITKYRASQKQLHDVSDKDAKILKLKKEMDVEVLAEDKERFLNSPSKTKADAYADWLKRVKTDVYINESTKVVSDVAISQHARTVHK